MSIVKKIDGYYFRGYVPRHLQLKYGKKTQDKKLYTNNKKEALKLVKIVKIEFEYEIYARYAEMANLDKKSVIRGRIDDYLNKNLKDREEGLYTSKYFDDIFDDIYDICIERIKAYENAILEGSYSSISHKYGTLNTDKSLIDILSIKLEADEMYYAQAYYVKALLNLEQTIKQKLLDDTYKKGNQINNIIPTTDAIKDSSDLSNNSNVINQLKEVDTSVPAQTDDNNIKKPISVPNLQQYHKEFMEYYRSNNNPTTDTISKHNLVIKSLLMYYGEDINVNEITAKDMQDYRAKLEKLPIKWSEKKAYKNCKTLKEIIETRDKSGKDLSKLKTDTVETKYIAKVNAFFDYVSSHENNFKNPVTHLKYGNNKKKLNSTPREEFLDEELEAIFATDFYTRKLEVNIKNHIELVYAPILALYSTMRSNELSSLYTNDIKELDGVYFFDINNNDEKTTKTKKSKRYIPIHQKIIEAGFLDYYKHMNKQGNVRLWTNLKKIITNPDNDKGRYGKEIGVWFNKLVDDYVTKDLSRVFHSLRKNAIDSLKQNSDASLEQRYAIQGHTDKSDSDVIRMDKLYSNPMNPNRLKPFVDQMKYEVKSLDEAIKNIGILVKKHYV